MKRDKILIKWFTLVELIIVITILTILAIIAFLSFQSYVKSSRDSNRIATVSNIEKWLTLYQVKTWNYPLPEIINGTWYLHNTTNELVYVGNIETEMVRKINMNTTPLDPLFQENYIYGISHDKRFFQIATIHENLQANIPWIPNTYASENITAYVKGNYNKVLPYTFEWNNCISNIPSLIFNSDGVSDLSSENIWYIINKSSNTPYKLSGQILIPTSQILQSISSTGSVWNVCSEYIKQKDNFSQIKEELENTLWYEIDEIWPTLFPDYIPIWTWSTNQWGNNWNGTWGWNNNGNGNSNNPWDNSVIIPSWPFDSCGEYDNTSTWFAWWDGSESNPYLICNAQQLAHINSSVSILTAGNYYKLVSNIDLSWYSNWTPIWKWEEPFIGNFDGNNLTIQGLNINTQTLWEAGLFWVVINWSFKDLNIIWWDITWTSNIGILAWVMIPGNAHNVKVQINNIEWQDYIWGLAGVFQNGNITDTTSHINNIKWNNTIWWLVGMYQNGNISNSSSYIGNDIQWWDTVWGLAGMIQNGNMNNSSSYIVHDLKWQNYVWWLVGMFANGSITDSFLYVWNNIQWHNMVWWWVGQYTNGGIMSNTTSEVKNILANGQSIWGLVWFYSNSNNIINSSSKIHDIIIDWYGTHIWGLIWYIDNTASITSSHSQINNITGSGNIVWWLVWRTNGDIISSYSRGNNIIGTHELWGLSWWTEENSTIKDSYSIYNDIIWTDGLGGFLWRGDGKIENSYSKTRNIEWDTRLWGFIWATYYDTNEILDSHSETNNISGWNDVGWFLWVWHNNWTISWSYSIAHNITGKERVGGFIWSQNWDNPQITQSYSQSADITWTKSVGGFTGRTTSSIKTSYAIAENIYWDSDVGWFVGENQRSGGYEGLIENSYVQAKNIIGTGDNIAWFAGKNWAKIRNSYSYITGLNSPGKKAAFVGNSFTSVESSFIHTFSGNESIPYFEEYNGPGISGSWDEFDWIIGNSDIDSDNEQSNTYGKQNLTTVSFLSNTNWDTNIWGQISGKNNNLPYLKAFEQ